MADVNYLFMSYYSSTYEERNIFSSVYQTNFELSGFIRRLPTYYETKEPFEPVCEKSKNISFSTDEEVMQELRDYHELYLFYLDDDNQERASLGNNYHSLLENWDANHELLCTNR